MESRVIFQDGMDIDPADFNNLQDFAQQSIDDVVADGVTSGRKYAGFETAASGVTTITVRPGRFYSGGKVYVADAVFTKDFTTILPVATKKIVSVVVFATEVDTHSVPREFLINEDTGASEPRVVATEHARIANVNTSAGQENADPLPPVLDAAVIEIARITLSPTGISTVEMIADNKLDSVQSVSDRVEDLEAFQADAAPSIVALGSDIAALKTASKENTDQAVFGRILTRLATLEAKAGIPTTATDSQADFLLDASKTDLPNSLVKVEEGARFADEAADTKQLQIFDALNPKAKIVNGVMFPAYNRAVRLKVGNRSGEVQASAYTYQTHNMVERTVSRQRLRVGYNYTLAATVSYWGLTNYYYWNTFKYVGETWTYFGRPFVGYSYVRLPYYWYDTVEDHYWDQVTVDHAVPGAQVAETFLNANDMWLDAVGLTFTRLAADGSVTVCVCETDRGMPDLGKVISFNTVTRDALLLNTETVIPLQPVFLEGGKRYAILIITAADHWLATTQGENFPQGTFFYVLDGAYQQGDGSKDLCFTLYAAKFTASRAVIDMQPLSLSGGISSIDMIASTIVPGGANLTYEVQISNVWVPLSEADPGALGAGGNIPPLLPLRAVFTGTPDVMPAVTLTGSQVMISRPRTSLTHVSAERDLPASSTQIRVIARLEAFDAAHHTCTCKLLTGAGYTTETDPSSTVDVVNDDGSIERTFVFNLGAGVTSFKSKISGTTDSALNTFNIAWRKDYAL
jgi:hypothetical protein